MSIRAKYISSKIGERDVENYFKVCQHLTVMKIFR